MLRIIFRATLIALMSAIASIVIAQTLVPMLGGTFDGSAWLMCVICPFALAFPASSYAMVQNRRLRLAHDELAQAHRALERAHAKLTEKSRQDAMTGTLNREAFFGILDATRRKTDRGALLLVDADHFKRINESYGHLAGDDALIDIAAAIGRALRDGDHLGRIGGEEFGVFLPGTDIDTARDVAEAIRAAVQAIGFMPAQGTTMTLTVSIGGVACLPDANTATLMRDADRLLHQAKISGRNRVVLDTPRRMAA